MSRGCLAAYTSGGWRFVAPVEGLTAYIRSSGTWAAYLGGAWEVGILRGESLVIDNQQVVGGRGPAIPSPAGGSTVDAQARAAVDQVLGALRLHGLIAT